MQYFDITISMNNLNICEHLFYKVFYLLLLMYSFEILTCSSNIGKLLLSYLVGTRIAYGNP